MKTEKKQNNNKKNKGEKMELISQAIAEKADINIINALIEREKEIKQEEAKKSFYQAKLLLQSELPAIRKTQTVVVADKDGKIVSYSYASLEDILKIVKPYLKKYGFTYRWEFSGDDYIITCSCILTHVDGHSEVSTMTSARDNSEDLNNIQSVGSTRTYLQRYTLGAVLGLVFDEDNDGRTSKTKNKVKTELIPAPKPKQKQEEEEIIEIFGQTE